MPNTGVYIGGGGGGVQVQPSPKEPDMRLSNYPVQSLKNCILIDSLITMPSSYLPAYSEPAYYTNCSGMHDYVQCRQGESTVLSEIATNVIYLLPVIKFLSQLTTIEFT